MGKQLAVLPLTDDAPTSANEGQDAVKSVGEVQDAPPSASLAFLRARTLVVDREWTEKALAVVDAAQQFALLWQLSQPWPWPARWLRASRPLNAFNLDVLSFRATGSAMGSTAQSFSLWGEMRHYWAYALAWSLVPPLATLAIWLAGVYWRQRGDVDFHARRIRWENALLQLFQVLYVPIGLAVFRLVNCDEDGTVSVDPTGLGVCGGARHVAAVVFITGVLGGGFLLGFPVVLATRIRSSLIYDEPAEHEHLLRSKELEYVLGTSESYLELYMPLYASYRREAATAPVESCLLKLLLLLVFTMIRSPAPRTNNQSLQGVLFFAVLVVRAVRQASRRLYRCGSSSVVDRALAAVLAANGLLGLLCASGVRSALTVSTAMTSMLTFVNVKFLVVMALYLLRTAYEAREHGRKQSTGIFWLSRQDVKAQLLADPGLVPMVAALRDARALVREALLVTPAIRPYSELEEVLRRLEACYSLATASKHYLSDQLREVMHLVADVLTDAMASNPFHCIGFPKFDLQRLGGVRRRQRKRRLLMDPIAQRVLTKLDAARLWKVAQPHVQGYYTQGQEISTRVDGSLEST